MRNGVVSEAIAPSAVGGINICSSRFAGGNLMNRSRVLGLLAIVLALALLASTALAGAKIPEKKRGHGPTPVVL
jgi:uncharacterized membrane protein (UPF0136 family)